MIYIQAIGSLLIFLFSIYGYFGTMKRKLHIKTEYMPAFLFSIWSVWMFLCGILGVMNIGFYILYGVGIVLALYSMFKKESPRFLWNEGLVIFMIFIVIFVLLLYGCKFTRYDNFSHWALVAKSILQNHRFPQMTEAYIEFQAYPTGSACFIYIFCRLFGESEWLMMLAQAILTMSFLIPVTAVVKGEKEENAGFPSWVLTIAFFVFVLGYNTALRDLVVDNLLVSIPIACHVILFQKHEMLKKRILQTVVFMTFLISVKNSAVFFVAIYVVEVCILLIQEKGIKPHFKALWGLIAAGLPVLSVFLWKWHVARAFSNGTTSKHAMSVNYYKEVFQTKGMEDIVKMLQLFFSELVQNNLMFWVFLLTLGSCILYLLCKKKSMFATLGSMAGIYAAYQIGLIATYIFSMPIKEAMQLASFERYQKTIHVYLLGIFIIKLIAHQRQNRIDKQIYATLIAVLMLCIGMMGNYEKENFYFEKTNEKRALYDILFDNYEIEKGKRYLICGPKDESGYYYYMAKYFCMSVGVVYTSGDASVEELKNWQNYDYILVLKERKKVRSFLKDTFGKQGEENVIRIS